MKRAVLIASGIVLLLLGLLLIAAGGAAAALFGSDGSLSTAPARVSGTGVALVIEDIAIDASSIPVPDNVGSLTLTVSNPQGGSMFVGSAPGDAVDTYLTGAPYDVVVEVAAGSAAKTREVPGTQQPPPPTSQGFWTRQATGTPAELTAKSGAATTLVVMNADASPGVTADLVVTLTVARAWTYAWVAVGVGALLILLAVLAFWRARVARRRARAAAATVPAPAPVAAVAGATILPGADASAAEPPVVADELTDVSAAAAALEPEPPESVGTPQEAMPTPEVPTPEVPTPEVSTPDAPAPTAPALPVEAAAATGLAAAVVADGVPAPSDADAAPADVAADSAAADGADEVAATPVDMASLFAPAVEHPGVDDATAVIPTVPSVLEPPTDPDTTGSIVAAEPPPPAG